MKDFPCTSCGLCCKGVGRAVNAAKDLLSQGKTDPYIFEVANFPHPFNSDGTCLHLKPDNSCAIYESRPDICNVATTWNKYHKDYISKENYFLSAAMLCNSMMVEAAIPDNFFIQIPTEAEFLL